MCTEKMNTATAEKMDNLVSNARARRKNKSCVRDIVARTTYELEGYGQSFSRQICFNTKVYSHEKACRFIDRLLDRWENYLKRISAKDPYTHESMASHYIKARRDLYWNWLYITMRCSTIKGGYRLVTDEKMTEEPTFLFLMEQAENLYRSWCVMAWMDGNVTNAPFYGFQDCFGLHFYLPLCEKIDSLDSAPVSCPYCITDAGSVKQYMLGRFYDGEEVVSDFDVDEQTGGNHADLDKYIDETGCSRDVLEHLCKVVFKHASVDSLLEGDLERLGSLDYCCSEAFSREKDEYLETCVKFMALFRLAGQDVLHGFCHDMSDIFSLYLIETDASPMADTDAALDVYSCVYDYAYGRAKHYGEKFAKKRPVND